MRYLPPTLKGRSVVREKNLSTYRDFLQPSFFLVYFFFMQRQCLTPTTMFVKSECNAVSFFEETYLQVKLLYTYEYSLAELSVRISAWMTSWVSARISAKLRMSVSNYPYKHRYP